MIEPDLSLMGGSAEQGPILMKYLRSKKHIPIIVAILFLVQTAACCDISSSYPTPMPRHKWLISWLETPTCQPPCWENIVPGKTTFDEAEEILNNLSDVSIFDSGPGVIGTKKNIAWVFDGSHDTGILYTDDEGVIVSTIGLGTRSSLPLEDVLFAYGQPDYVLVTGCRGEPIKIYCNVHLIYPESGMALSTDLGDIGKEKYTVEIIPSTRIKGIELFPSGEHGYASTLGAWNPNISEYFVDWTGYGNYLSLEMTN